MLEIVPDIAQSTHGIRNILVDNRNVPTRPHMVLGMFLLAFPVSTMICPILFINDMSFSAHQIFILKVRDFRNVFNQLGDVILIILINYLQKYTSLTKFNNFLRMMVQT